MPRATPIGLPQPTALALLLAACTAQPPAPVPQPGPAPAPAQPVAVAQPVAQPVAVTQPPRPGALIEVHGRVLAWGGTPIAGATITTAKEENDASARDPETRSDADGRFSLQVRSGGLVALEARAPGHAPGLDEGPAPGHAFELWLAPESTLGGTVTRDGAPVAGASVLAERSGGLSPVTAEAVTDATGAYRLTGLDPGSYSLRALTDDAAGAPSTAVTLGLDEDRNGLDINLTPALRITGQILGGDAPCKAGSLSLLDESRGNRLNFPTGPEGQVNARGLLPGEYQLSVTCTGFLPAAASLVRVVDRALLDQRWTLAPGLALRGRVLAADGTPATRLHVYATAERDPADPKLFSYAETEPDADGRFELTGLVPGPYRVTIAADHGDARAVPQEPLHVVLAADTPELTLTMPVTGELRGVLRDAGGHAIDRAMVMLAGSADAQHVLAGDDGSFLFPAVAPRDYHLIARRNSQRLAGATLDGQPVTITAGGLTTTTAIVAAPDQRLTGLVRDAASAPVAGAFVVLRSRSQQLLAPPVETDAAGRFTVPALAPGKYRVRAYRRGGGEALTDAVEAGSDLTLTLAAP